MVDQQNRETSKEFVERKNLIGPAFNKSNALSQASAAPSSTDELRRELLDNSAKQDAVVQHAHLSPMLERWFQESMKDQPYHNLRAVGQSGYIKDSVAAPRKDTSMDAGQPSPAAEGDKTGTSKRN